MTSVIAPSVLNTIKYDEKFLAVTTTNTIGNNLASGTLVFLSFDKQLDYTFRVQPLETSWFYVSRNVEGRTPRFRCAYKNEAIKCIPKYF